jgi:glycosyltransferase involved in cell wall biosynthesis
MRRKACHITSVHKRHDIRIFLKECTTLAKNGYEVTLVVNDELEDEIIDNIKIVSTKFVPKNRLDRMLNSNKHIYEKALKMDADIYHLHDPDLIPVANKLKRKNKVVILDSHEDVPSDIQDKDWIPKHLRNIIASTYAIYEAISAKRYDGVICVTPNVMERFIKINKNTVMVTNYPIVHQCKTLERNPSNYICYAGAIEKTWNHDKIIKAINKVDGLKYLLAGRATRKYIELLQKLPEWNKVDYIGVVPHSEVTNIYNQSIAGIALNYCNQLVRGGGTLGNNKLFEYMNAGLPVICTNYELWKGIIEKYNCGICVDPNNIQEIERAIRYINDNPEKATAMGLNGRKAVQDVFNWSTQEITLLAFYERI